MEELFKKVFNQKLQDGSIEKIVSDQIDSMIKDILKDSMSWSGTVRKTLEERLKPIMLDSVANCDLSQTAAMVTDLLNNAVKTSPLNLIQDTYKGISTLFNANSLGQDISFGKVVSLTDIFKVYIGMIENTTYSDYELENKDIQVHQDEGKYAYIEAQMSIDPVMRSNGKDRYEITLHNNFDKEDIVFEISESYDKTLRINLDTDNMLLAELRHLSPMYLYLLQLKSMWCDIRMNTSEEYDEIRVEVC